MICIRGWAFIPQTIAAGILVLTGLALPLFAQVVPVQRAVAQQFLPGQKKVVVSTAPGTASGFSSIRIVENGDMRRTINVGRDCIKDKDWKQAVQALQFVLSETQDYYVKVTDTDRNGKESPRWTSVKFEANNLIGSMDQDGLDQYELSYGKEAKDLLDDAKARGDRMLLENVALRYCHTQAGVEANEILATLLLARGQVFTAALRFDKLLARKDRTKLGDLTLFKAALAFRRAGETKNFEKTWKILESHLENKPGLNVGNQVIPLAKLQEVLSESPVVDIVNRHDWPRIRGNPPNTAQAYGSPPLMDTVLWKRPVMMDKLEGFTDQDDDRAAEERVSKSIEQVGKTMHAPILPGSFPIASQGIMVYRTQRDVRAVALKPIEIRDEGTVTVVKPGEILWKTLQLDRSLAVLLSENKTRSRVEQWIDAYHAIPGYSSFLYENSLVGTLSTDHRLVYVINDLAVPPIPNIFHPFAWNQPQFNPQEIKPLLENNELHAYDLVTGKRVWDINHEVPDFKNSHFLGQPITVGGKLYILNEKVNNLTGPGANPPGVFPGGGGVQSQFGGDSELRLVCIDPTKVNADGKPEVGKVQVLGHLAQQDRFVQDPRRRVSAVHLGFAEGILVCPTNAGEIFGIDVMTGSLVWSYAYREAAPGPIVLPNQIGLPIQAFPVRPNVANVGPAKSFAKWKTAPPALQDGKVVFTAPDADSVHCINLRDGNFVWKRSYAEGDQYMAGVFQGKVLIVGKANIRALNLKDGTQAWSVATGDTPSGQGVASKGIYYLPLSQGEILAVEIDKGEVKAHNRAAAKGVTPGNLIFYDGMVLSQTTSEVAAYPQLIARLEAAKLDVAKEPENLTRMTEYGELLFKDGQVPLAVETLLRVFNKKPADPLGQRVRDRLFEALTDLMQLDFDKASKDYLTIYQGLCAVPDNPEEEQSRKAKYFRLVGQGRQAQGNLVEAFQMYKDFGALPIHRQHGGIASLEDANYKIPVNVWLRGRISGMFANATPEQREPLEAKIAEEWKAVEARNDLDQIRSFVGMFDVPFGVGREARIRLAENIMERNDRSTFLEAELLLHQVMGSEFRRDPQVGGRALAALAQLEEKKGTADSMRLAASYYQELGRDFANARVRGPRTGAELVNELATDKRFLPFLEEAPSPFTGFKVAAHLLPAASFDLVHSSGFVMRSDGDHSTFARLHRLILDLSDANKTRIRLRDLSTNQDRWDVNLGFTQMNQVAFFNIYNPATANQAYFPNARFRFYQVKGHLIVCQIGVMVYCIDGDTGKKLWEMQTVENVANSGTVTLENVTNDDHDGNPVLSYWNQLTNQRFRVNLGRIGTAQASYVAVLGHKGLTVVDPLRGTTLWKKSDVPINSHVFGDNQYLFVVEATETGGLGAGRTLRASDGEVLKIDDFSNAFGSRIRVMSRQILAAQPSKDGLMLRLYDIISGKDLWTKAFPAGSVVLQTEDANLTGVIEPAGKTTILDARTGNEILTASVVHNRIGLEDIKGLKEPLLLADHDRFYIALNKPIDFNKVGSGILHNNFSNGTRSVVVNGWVLALERKDGQQKAGDKTRTWKKGDFVWHSYASMSNQMLVLEQFDRSPVMVFTTWYLESRPNVGNRWVSMTQALHKTTGKMLYDSTKVVNGQSPMFVAFEVDLKSRAVNLISLMESVQFFADEGKGPPPLPSTAAANGARSDAIGSTTASVPFIRRIVERQIQAVPALEVAK